MNDITHRDGCGRAFSDEATCSCCEVKSLVEAEPQFVSLAAVVAERGKYALISMLLSGELDPAPNRGGFYLRQPQR